MNPSRLAVLGVLVVLSLVGLAACGSGGSTETVTVEQGSQEPEDTTSEPASEGKPEVEHEIASCDLGGNLTELIGSVQATNKGDAAADVTVSFKWQLGDGSYVTAQPKQVELEPGAEELVFFSKHVTLNEATSFQDHPGYYEGTNCAADVEGGEGGASGEADDEAAEAAEPTSDSGGAEDVEHEIASCDLGGNLTELIGSVQATNKGDAAAEVTVSFKWQLGDGSYVTAQPKQVELEPGAEELVFFSKHVTLNEATSFQDHPGYYEGTNCKADVSSE